MIISKEKIDRMASNELYKLVSLTTNSYYKYFEYFGISERKKESMIIKVILLII